MARPAYDVAAGDLADHAKTLRMVARYIVEDFVHADAELLNYPLAGIDDRDHLGQLITDTVDDLRKLAEELSLASAQLDATAAELLAIDEANR